MTNVCNILCTQKRIQSVHFVTLNMVKLKKNPRRKKRLLVLKKNLKRKKGL